MSNTYKPLDDLLNKSGLKKEAIARKMNIDVSYLYKLRSNPKNISAIRLGEMAEVTGVDFAELYSTVKKFALEHDKLAKKDKWNGWFYFDKGVEMIEQEIKVAE